LLKKTTQMNALFDFYQSLLTPKQREYMKLYFWEDYSLGEISDAVHVSRQAIYDNIKRTEKVLIYYEERLQLYEDILNRKQLLKKLETVISEGETRKGMELIRQLKEID